MENETEINVKEDEKGMSKQSTVVIWTNDVIPQTPSLYLNNYLRDLIISNRGKGNDGIRIYGVRSILRKFTSNKKRGHLAKTLGTSRKNLDHWVGVCYRDIGIPADKALTLIQLVNKNEGDLFNYANSFGCTNSKKYGLPKVVTPQLAYLLGYIMGDGHLANPNKLINNGSKYNAEVRITTGTKEHLLVLRQIFRILFNYEPPIYKEGNFYRLVARSKVIHRFLHKVCGVPVGNKRNKTCVPKIIKNKQIYEKWFLCGFFDADGTIYIDKTGRINIRIKQFNKRILDDCRRILIDEGVNPSGTYQDNGFRLGTKTTAHVLVIYRKCEVRKFIRNFHTLKVREVFESKKLQDYI